MLITIDLRSLQRGVVSGVETYTYNVVKELLRLDRENRYRLFYNSIRIISAPDMHFINAVNVQRKIPNKLLALTKQFGWPLAHKYIGESDVLWMPNLNHINPGKGGRFVLTVHDMSPFLRPEFYDLKRNLWHKSVGFRNLVNRADAILAVSEYTKNDLINHFNVPAGKIVVTYEGVNHRAYYPLLPEDGLRRVRNIYELPGNFILYLGTLEPRKNVAGLIRAFDKLKNDAWLVLAGRPGWKYSEIFTAMKRSPKKNKIKLLGFVDEPDKPFIMKLANVFAFPSFYEGFGLPVLEAMAVGTPVVTSSVTSLPEVTGTAALLANPYSTEELSFALEQAAEDSSLRNSLIIAGLARAKQFSWKQTAEKTLAVLTAKPGPKLT